jgi:hypothetical protein
MTLLTVLCPAPDSHVRIIGISSQKHCGHDLVWKLHLAHFMNTNTRILGIILATSFLAMACGSHEQSLSGGFFEGAGDPSSELPSDPNNDNSPGVDANGLTAGIWDDNLNFRVFESYLADTANYKGIPSISLSEQTAAKNRFGVREGKQSVDVLLLLDTTGSMYDEIDYLTEEFQNISTKIQNDFCRSAIDIRWGLVVYGDQGEIYVVRSSGFSQNAEAFKQELENIQRTSGGDYPEAAAEGLDAATQVDWRTGDDVARLVFWVADAPHHENKTPMIEDAIRRAMTEDIHIYPVAASGLDDRTEKLMRISAQVTGGRYIFLTDDSGIGNSHKEPRIPCYFVTSLTSAITRSIKAEITGALQAAHPDEVLRSGGDPQSGSCTLTDGSQVLVF